MDAEPVVRLVPPAGRYEELHLCTRWLGEAAAGQPRIVLVEGEAGVGKTTLLRAVQEAARARNAQVGTGTFQPEDLAHRAVTEALAAVVPPGSLPTGPAGIPDAGPDAAAGAADVPPERLMAELFTGTGAALVEACRTRPVVLTLDDLHWADRPSVDLLGLLFVAVAQAATSGPVPLMVLMTGRVADESSTASSRLSSLRRFPGSRRLTLQALSEASLGQILSSRFGSRLSPRLLRQVHESTGGRPLHAEMMLEGALARSEVTDQGGILVDGPGFRHQAAHRSLEDEVADQLENIDDEDREVLAVAACLGTAGAASTLALALEHPDGEPVSLAPAAQRLVSLGDTFEFRHPQVHRAVVRSDGRRRRSERHCAVAVRLVERLPPGGDNAALIDRQLRLGGDAVDPALVYRVAREVGDHSLATAAWADAARAYERAALAAERLGLDAATLAELHVRAGTAAAHDHDAKTAAEHFERAIDVARPAGDVDRWGRAVLGLGRALLTSGQDHVFRRAPIDELHALVSEVGSERSELAAQCQELLAEIAFTAGDYGDGFACTQRARDLAGGSDEVLALVDFAEGLQFMGALQVDRAEDLFRSSRNHATSAGNPWVATWGLTRLALLRLLRAEVVPATEAAAAAAGVSATLGNWAEHAIALACSAWAANLRGDFADAEAKALEAAEFVHRSDYAFGPLMVFPQLAWSRAIRGDWTGAEDALADWAAFGARGTRLAHGVIRAALTPDDERAAFIRPPDGPVTINSLFVLAGAAELARARGDRSALAALAGTLAATAAGGTRVTPLVSLFLDRFSAHAGADTPPAAVADRLAGAAARAADLGMKVEAARCTLDQAEVLREVEPDRAASLAAAALEDFHRMDALSLAIRAERLAQDLAGSDRPAASASPLTRTILFTDIVDSTRRNAELGDTTFLEVLRSHNDLIRGRLREFAGAEFKHTGDGIAAWFRNPDDATGCCLAVQADLETLARAEPEYGLRVRMGLAAGVPLENEGDLFGLAVVRAARVCDRAGAGQILAAEEVVGHLSADRYQAVLVGQVQLKGLPEPVGVYRVNSRPD